MKSMKIVKDLLHVLLVGLALLGLTAQAGVEITYIHNDALGSPVAGTDEQGNVKWRSHYQPYGEEVLGERSAFGVRSGYTGHREDPETALTYMGARYYSPALGRFMGVDPAGVSESNLHSFNRYAYANNNPYKYIDPDGRVVETAFDVVSLGLSIAQFKQDPSIVNGLGVAFDGLATVVPFLPGGFGIIKTTGNIADGIGDSSKGIPDSTLVCRGGSCTSEAFTNGSGVVTDPVTGKLSGVSTGIGDSVEAASRNIPHPKVGVSTAGEIRAAGGEIVNDKGNHANVSGVTADKAAELFGNVVKNPNR